MTNRRRLRALILGPALAGALLAAPAALGASAHAAAPAATCSISGVLPNGRVHLSGGGFQPGTAYFSSPQGWGGTVTIEANGGFNAPNVHKADYTVSQGSEQTHCYGY
ncbi:hypothetical protein [Streptomyces antimicrobicus]|uniref:Uncharacterized protein n=1 Tax=Streptomyces antimicrobicus TaxID=2883108 RepID=A0ABS8B3C0_9ACTN|nr:hypothetical protein [Streptomyces antimicrobicus]MCB5179100.1 hypothetical protein [Streptomyces antimicrobicus]